jgi:DNA-binding response OmpR family regulator
MEDIKPNILIVEDDIELAQWMQEYLLNKAFDVAVVHNGEDAIVHIQDHNPDIVILDGMLPGIDGIDVCKVVRPKFTNTIIMVTARDEEIDEVLGLEMGADEYLTKPVRARALLTRIRKHLDRQQLAAVSLVKVIDTIDAAQHLIFNSLEIDKQTMIVTLRGENIPVTTSEFDLLWILAKRAGQIVSRNDLIKELRGFDYDGFNRSIDLKISRLRKKLGDTSSESARIKTIWGKGYLFFKDAW